MSTQRAQQNGNVVTNLVAGRTAADHQRSRRAALRSGHRRGIRVGRVLVQRGRRRRSRRGQGRLPGLGGNAAGEARQLSVQVQGAAGRASRGDRPPHQRRARQDARRRVGRGRSRHRGGGFRLRYSAPAQGRFQPQRRPEHRHLQRPRAPGRRGRNHAVQFSRDGSVVDVPGGHRVRQHVRPQAFRARPVRTDVRRGTAARDRTARAAC